ncbi:multiheme c-type cytochrome [Mucilaginibacter sp. MD40]|uniref:multiheme c-type cytochrome n=1 Tax=Mucilaginibacter sp. MD40 TaxID=2029590 RepID=UPI00117C0198|nr:multiheme c-type cytochrome [Mucilaginibacter sp. MD40]
MKSRYLVMCAVFLLPVLLIISQCSTSTTKADPRGADYAGAKTCISCHKNLDKDYLHTAHYQSSAFATENAVHGIFAGAKSEMNYNNHSRVKMLKTDSGMYQVNYINGQEAQKARMDLVMGGVKGETYLYWKENELFQLPVSFDYAQNKWIVSPGYDTVMASYDRAVNVRCLECHATYAATEPGKAPSFGGEVTGFNKASMVLRIDCERCHGPGREHAEYQLSHPQEKTGRYITDISKLTRTQQTDLCGTCHSGTQTDNKQSIFNFKPGDKLTDYKTRAADAGPPDLEHIDVHGNQLEMLKTSRCFTASQMNCSSCHAPHTDQHKQTAIFAARCGTCHKATNHNLCKLTGRVSDEVLKTKCVDCHMPMLPSKAIINEQHPVLIRTHHIAVYPDKAKQILAYLKKL